MNSKAEIILPLPHWFFKEYTADWSIFQVNNTGPRETPLDRLHPHRKLWLSRQNWGGRLVCQRMWRICQSLTGSIWQTFNNRHLEGIWKTNRVIHDEVKKIQIYLSINGVYWLPNNLKGIKLWKLYWDKRIQCWQKSEYCIEEQTGLG